MRSLLKLTLFFALTWYVQSLRILGIFQMASYSHHTLGSTLLKELAVRGHDVTMISPYVEKNPVGKYRSIQLTGYLERMEEMHSEINMFNVGSSNPFLGMVFVNSMGYEFTSATFAHPNVQKLLKSNEKFDVILIDQFVNDAIRGFCHHFNASCVIFSAVGSTYWTNKLVGNPANPAYIPEMSLRHSGPMNYLQRLQNTAFQIFEKLMFHSYFLPQHNKLLLKHFPNSPPLSELIYDTPLILLNSHVSTYLPVPHLPNMIEIGGYHVQPPKKLPEDLQKYLDGAKHGAVYFSMGSNLRSKSMEPGKLDAILKAFAKLKLKVLWKFEEDNLPGKPDNVMIRKWLPQSDILAHPNIKLFITHGGLLSTIEAIYHGVPVVGIPIYGDQAMNMLIAVEAGYGQVLDYRHLTEDALSATLNEVLSNKKYAENAKRRSKLMHDQPMKPIDTAVFWIEYVGRHKGAKHFRSAALDLSWYQLMLLDVIGTFALAAIVVMVVTKRVIKRLCCARKDAKAVSKSRKNK